MKKLGYVFIFITIFFLNYLNVFAGVCDGKTKFDSGYCNLGTQYSYAIKENTDSFNKRFFAKKAADGNAVKEYKDGALVGNGYIGYGYEAESGTFSGQREYAFCLDPGKNDPTNYGYGRELNIATSRFDEDVYKTYQYYVNSVAYDKNNKTYTDIQRHKHIAYADVVLRIYTAAYGYGFDLANRVYYYKNVLPYIIGSNRTKLTNRVGTSSIEPMYNSLYFGSDGCKKKDSNLSNTACLKTWAANISDVNSVRTYFDKVLNGPFLWSNPLSITPNVEKLESGDYKFSFEVNFKNDKHEYFGIYDNGKHYDYDVGYGNAYFKFNGFQINDNPAYSGYMSDTSFATTIDHNNSDNNNPVVFSTIIKAENYESLMASEDNIYVTMKYQTYHPMSVENVFINYENERTAGTSTAKQRMVVFTKYDKEKNISSNKIGATKAFCVQNGNNFYYKGVLVSLSNYKNYCGCLQIDGTVLNSTNEVIYNNFLCPNKVSEDYSGGLRTCEDDDGNDELSYTIEKNNVSGHDLEGKYAKLICKEKISIKNMVKSDLTTKAGMHFGLGSDPNVVANKTCTVEVNYSEWYNDYETKLLDEINAFNKYIKDYRIDNATETSEQCYCIPFGGCVYAVRHNYTYEKLSYSYGSISSTSYSGYWGGCAGISKPSTNTAYSRAQFNNKYNDMINHFNILKETNKVLNKFPSMYDFYKFDSELRFYYEQEYSNSDIGIKRNDERDDYDNVDDSLFASNLTEESESGNFNDSKFINNSDSYPYLEPIGSAPFYQSVSQRIGYNLKGGGDYNINRIVEYDYEYKPSVLKYVDSYTAKISTFSSRLSNPIKLGYYYDTDYSAVEKTNTNYYLFTKLGEQNKIYDHFANEIAEITYNNQDYEKNGVQRFCTYKTTNELLETCEGNACDPKLNIAYRIVDPKNIDPNHRLIDEEGNIVAYDGSNGFNNWRNPLGESVKNEIESTDIFNPLNLEYSFYLDSKTISDIREYNKLQKSYDDEFFGCTDGNQCESAFVTYYAKKDDYGEIPGRNNWK